MDADPGAGQGWAAGPELAFALAFADRAGWAALGGGAYRGDTRLAVSSRDGLAVPATVNGGGSLPTPAGLNTDGLIQRETGRASFPHRFPWPSVFSGCQVAEGFWEAELYSGSAAWDVAAIALLVTEAGGHGHRPAGRAAALRPAGEQVHPVQRPGARGPGA